MEETDAEVQLRLARKSQSQGNDAAAKDAALRASASALNLPVEVVGAGVDTAADAIELANRDVFQQLLSDE